MATYLETYQNSLSEGLGLVSALSPLSPWQNIGVDQFKALERAYSLRSGFKTVLPAFLTISEEGRVSLLSAMFNQKWTRMWEDYSLEYGTLDAYLVEETGNKEITRDNSRTIKYGKTVRDIGSDTGTVTNEGSDTNTMLDNVYGFNSNSAVPSTSGNDNTSSESTETRNISTTRDTTNAGQDERNDDDRELEDYQVTKRGNIGYSTPQKLLREDIELWARPFFDIVFSDIDSVITIMVY